MFTEELWSELGQRDLKVLVFSVVRDEMVRLPAFLNHYRGMGIKTFVIVDNGSRDGTFEYLRAQSDVLVFRTSESYAASNFGMKWLNELHQKLKSIWILYADADELLVYKGWPNKPIAELCADAANQNCNSIFGTMVDMYPDGPLESASAGGSADLFALAPCFDKDYHFRLTPVKPWREPFKLIEVIGGPRVRLASSWKREVATGWFTYAVRGQIDRILPLTPDRFLPWVVRMWPKQPPALAKTPLVLSGSGVSYATGHGGPGSRFHRESTVICHFKFLSDFAERVRHEAVRGEHYRRGAEYIVYAEVLKKFNEIDLRYEGTQRFSSVDQFVSLGLIRDVRPLLDEPKQDSTLLELKERDTRPDWAGQG